MPRGYRCVILAAVGCLILGASPTPDNSVQAEHGETSREIKSAAQTVAAAIRQTIKSTEQDRGCAKGENKRESDLCAQWKAADAARDAAEYAFWTMLIGLVGTGFLVWTFWETRVTARRQLRAYLDFSEVQLTRCEVQDPETEVEWWETRYKIVNFGETPAFGISSHDYIRRAALGDVDHRIASKRYQLGALSRGDDISSASRIAFHPRDIARVKAGEDLFTLELSIKYRDAFGRQRTTDAEYVLQKNMALGIKSGAHLMT